MLTGTPTEAESALTATDFEPITSREQLDKIVGAARKADKAKLVELQQKAKRLDEIEQASMSEAEKAAARVRELETQLEVERHGNLRRDVAAAKGVPAERISGSTREELEQSADELIAYIAERTATPPKPVRPAAGLKSGATGTDTRMDPMERAANAVRQWASGALR